MSVPEAGSYAEPAFAVPEVTDDTQLWIVRHGATDWSASGKHTGVTDVPLTDDGRGQAGALRDMLADLRPVRVVSSPRSRALDTARLAGLPVDAIDDDLVEWDYGDYEGLTTPQIREQVPDWTVWKYGCPGGESPWQVGQRADRLLRTVAPHLADGPVVLVGHGHFSRVLAARWIGLPAAGGASLLLGTAAPSVLGAEHGTPAVSRWNLPNPDA
jgi:probable phosphoglycerate mutase